MKHLSSEIRTFSALYNTTVDPQSGNIGTGIFIPKGYLIFNLFATCVGTFGTGGANNWHCNITQSGVSLIGGDFFDNGSKPDGFTWMSAFPTSSQVVPPSTGDEIFLENKGDPFIEGECIFLISAMIGYN